jgi:hypothetical protein
MENKQHSNAPIGMQATLPHATTALVLGIISIPTCCCLGIVGLVCGIIAIILGNKATRIYKQNPSLYNISSYNNATAGKICGIIGTVFSAFFLLYVIIYTLFMGALFSFGFSNMSWGDIN